MSTNENDGPVGYGRPPKHTQFAKGVSGYPKGRPKGSRNFATLLRNELNVKVTIMENGIRRKITKLEAIVKQMINKSAAGDIKAIPLLLNEIRSREGLPGTDQTGVAREEDQSVMASIVKRLREAIPPSTDPDAGTDSAATTDPAPTAKKEEPK